MKTLTTINKYLSHFWVGMGLVSFSVYLASALINISNFSIYDETWFNEMFYYTWIIPAPLVLISFILSLIQFLRVKDKKRFYGFVTLISVSLFSFFVFSTILNIDQAEQTWVGNSGKRNMRLQINNN